jgi:hypothetical protein
MELAIGVFSSMFGTAATAATSAASWAAGTPITTAAGVTSSLSSAAGLGSTALSILEGAASAASVLATVAGGVSANAEAKMQASAAELQAREQALRIQREELEKIGAARVAFAASGVSLASGAQVENALERDSLFEQNLVRSSGSVQASQIRLRGRGSLVAAAGKAAGTVADTSISLARRG